MKQIIDLFKKDFIEKQCSLLNGNKNGEICQILPKHFLDKVDMPKPITFQGSKIYVPK